MQRHLARIAAIIVLCGLIPVAAAPPALGQASGRVVSETAEPVSGARVELWSSTDRLGVEITDELGQFGFPADLSQNASEILVRRMGYHPARSQAQSRGEVVIRLYVEPVAIDGVTVEAVGSVCPHEPSVEARRRWESMSLRYSHILDTVQVRTRYVKDERVVPLGKVGAVRLLALERQGTVLQPEGSEYAWTSLIPAHGYAVPLTRSIDDEFARWLYPMDYLARHFVDPTFAELNTFEILAQSDRQTVIGFCPGEQLEGKPQISGRLVLSDGDELLTVRFEFITREPEEHSGGTLVYAPVTGSDGALLPVSSSSLYWRKLSGGDYFQKYVEYESWVLARDP